MFGILRELPKWDTEILNDDAVGKIALIDFVYTGLPQFVKNTVSMKHSKGKF